MRGNESESRTTLKNVSLCRERYVAERRQFPAVLALATDFQKLSRKPSSSGAGAQPLEKKAGLLAEGFTKSHSYPDRLTLPGKRICSRPF